MIVPRIPIVAVGVRKATRSRSAPRLPETKRKAPRTMETSTPAGSASVSITNRSTFNAAFAPTVSTDWSLSRISTRLSAPVTMASA